VVDAYLQAKRDATAKRFFRRLLRSHGGAPRKIVIAHAAVQDFFNLGRHMARIKHYRDLRASASSGTDNLTGRTC
jgi:transposase-like protein